MAASRCTLEQAEAAWKPTLYKHPEAESTLNATAESDACFDIVHAAAAAPSVLQGSVMLRGLQLSSEPLSEASCLGIRARITLWR